MAKMDYFNPSSNIEDRREEDPIKNFLIDLGIPMNGAPVPAEDIERFGNPQGTYDGNQYWAENPILRPTPLGVAAGANDLDQYARAQREAHAKAMREFWAGSFLPEVTQEERGGLIKTHNAPMERIPRK